MPINTAYKGAFSSHQVSTTSPKVAVISLNSFPGVLNVFESFESVELFILVGDKSETSKGKEELASLGKPIYWTGSSY